MNWIGVAVKRKEDPELITGNGNFVDDLILKGMLHAALLRSPYAHARIKNIDFGKAAKLPGVVSILTGRDCVKLMRPMASFVVPKIREYPLAVEKVRYAGEPVVAVSATSRAIAEDALELIDVEYEPLEVVIDPEKAMLPDSPVVFDELGTNIVWSGSFSYGYLKAEFDKADLVLEESFRFHRHSSSPLEPDAVIASFEQATGHVTIWSNLQLQGQSFENLAETLRIPSHKLRLIVPQIGGSFGTKLPPLRMLSPLISLLSMASGRPVKYIEDRRENLVCTQSCQSRIYVRAALMKDGEFTALEMKDIENEGGGLGFAVYHITNKLNNLSGSYRIKNLKLDGFSIATNQGPSNSNRGIGKPMMCFVWERLMDIAAKKLGLDPVEIRKRNYVRPEEFPYTTPNGNLYESGNYHLALDKALEIIGYEQQREFQRKARQAGRLVGIGFSTSVEPGGMNLSRHAMTEDRPTKAGASEAATIKIDVTGKVSVVISQPDAGEGHATTAAQIVADELGAHFDDIDVATSFDTLSHPWTGYSGLGGNDFTPVSVPSIVGAARELKLKILKVAGFILSANAEEIDTEASFAFLKSNPHKRVSFHEIAHLVYYQSILLPNDIEAGLQATYFYRHPGAKLPDENKRVRAQLTHGNAVHAAIVEVSRDTGVVNVLRYVIVCDSGRIINPAIVDGQVHGNSLYGIATTLNEEMIYDDGGQLLTSNFSDYFKPTAAEAPDMEVYHMESLSPSNPIGSKSVGEGGAILAPAAIANAVEDALYPVNFSNFSVNNLPLTRHKIWTSLNVSEIK